MNVLNATELPLNNGQNDQVPDLEGWDEKRLQWQIVCYTYFATIRIFLSFFKLKEIEVFKRNGVPIHAT